MTTLLTYLNASSLRRIFFRSSSRSSRQRFSRALSTASLLQAQYTTAFPAGTLRPTTSAPYVLPAPDDPYSTSTLPAARVWSISRPSGRLCRSIIASGGTRRALNLLILSSVPTTRTVNEGLLYLKSSSSTASASQAFVAMASLRGSTTASVAFSSSEASSRPAANQEVTKRVLAKLTLLLRMSSIAAARCFLEAGCDRCSNQAAALSAPSRPGQGYFPDASPAYVRMQASSTWPIDDALRRGVAVKRCKSPTPLTTGATDIGDAAAEAAAAAARTASPRWAALACRNRRSIR